MTKTTIKLASVETGSHSSSVGPFSSLFFEICFFAWIVDWWIYLRYLWARIPDFFHFVLGVVVRLLPWPNRRIHNRHGANHTDGIDRGANFDPLID